MLVAFGGAGRGLVASQHRRGLFAGSWLKTVSVWPQIVFSHPQLPRAGRGLVASQHRRGLFAGSLVRVVAC